MFYPEKQNKKHKIIAIFGSTGSIGCNIIKIIKKHPDKFSAKIITASENVELLAKQAIEVNAEIAIIKNEAKFTQLKELLKDSKTTPFAGSEAMIEMAKEKCDLHMAAISGMAGLPTTIAAMESKIDVAIANKESLVCAGHFMNDLAKKNKSNIIPIDSEHSAIFQVLDHGQNEQIKKIILTASGGPFLNLTKEQIKKVTLNDALKHPNWSMGTKNTIDSASMANKALEMIEAFYLFELKPCQIDVVIHPESIIHSLVAYRDGSHLAQIGSHSMISPISYSMSWPNRIEQNFSELEFDLSQIAQLNFMDSKQFHFLKIVRNCLESYHESGHNNTFLIFNIANEIAVNQFKNGKLNFHQISDFVEKQLNDFSHVKIAQNIKDVFEIEKLIKEQFSN